MNKTRKEIIELIEPYTDKTLSLGCYVTIPWYKREEWICIIADYSSDEWLYAFIWWKSMELYPINDIKPDKILWHYDITAVLKYIRDKCRKLDTDIKFDQNNIRLDFLEYNVLFPNKPLHLYSEQEEEDWLELLKKIWTT